MEHIADIVSRVLGELEAPGVTSFSIRRHGKKAELTIMRRSRGAPRKLLISPAKETIVRRYLERVIE